MTGIVVLWREADAARCYEVLNRCLKYTPVPLLATVYYDVDVNRQAVIVCTFSRLRGLWATGEMSEVKNLLLRNGAKTATVVELHTDAGPSAPRESLLDHRTESVVE